jgi:hypothetical protein
MFIEDYASLLKIYSFFTENLCFVNDLLIIFKYYPHTNESLYGIWVNTYAVL